MIERLMKRFALSEEGAKGLVRAVAACTVADLMLMLPVGLLYLLASDFLSGSVRSGRYPLYGLGIVVALLLILLSEFWKYNATYFSTYRESGACRIRLAEKLRRLPLSFFGKKDLADLTNTIMGDVQVTEQMFSHYVPQFYGAILSTCLVAVSLLCYDWQMALAALWVLPITLVILKLLSRGNVRFDLENLILMNVCISCLREVSNIFLLAFTARRCFWHFLVIVPSYPQGIANLLSQPERLQDLTAPHVL